jgi:hypothetical protein
VAHHLAHGWRVVGLCGRLADQACVACLAGCRRLMCRCLAVLPRVPPVPHGLVVQAGVLGVFPHLEHSMCVAPATRGRAMKYV